MKKFHKKSLVLLVCVTVMLTFTVSGTVAFLADGSGPVTNTFTPVEVDTKIVESVAAGQKSSIKVENNSAPNHIPVYVRVAVSGYWVDTAGNIVAPWDGTFAYNTTDWTQGADGYYYYMHVLAVGTTTTDLLLEDKPISQPTDKPAGSDHLVVTVVHQAIQAAGMNANSAQDAFTKAAQSNFGN